jgi:N-acetyl-anhydromuramyl-L-alanine amidase AmpD
VPAGGERSPVPRSPAPSPRAFLLPLILAGSALAPAAPLANGPGSELEFDSGEANRWQHIIVHHSATPGGNAADFSRLHRQKGWDDVAYHFVIDNGRGGPDGALEVTSRWREQKHGAHAGRLVGHAAAERNEFNEFGIGICLVGDFERRPPTPKQVDTLVSLITGLRARFNIPAAEIAGHGEVTHTDCPGRCFPWASVLARLQLPRPDHASRRTPAPTLDRCPWCFRHPEREGAVRVSELASW